MKRAIAMLCATALAGGLIWAASHIHRGSTAGFWAEVAILALAGLVISVSSLAGLGSGRGRLRVGAAPLILAFLPALVAAGWVLLAAQPNASALQAHIVGWSHDIHVGSVVASLTAYAPLLALALGLMLGNTLTLVEEPAAGKVDTEEPATVPARLDPAPIDRPDGLTEADQRRAPALTAP